VWRGLRLGFGDEKAGPEFFPDTPPEELKFPRFSSAVFRWTRARTHEYV